ncbi:MAG: MOSC domain-containing protein [Gammaproteobacteria bacterium]|jgi:MOSC domain-containing protein YiiM|nr:molybdenum cofactor biosysynthesis protein [Chromatiales bacterium]MCP4924594.1 MOSC domain-containing protein [Gammaproteobacteria bacterium]MDP7659887.1 MOSC domain-containing protein [Gammaproteobacteria bacterium]
MKLLSINASLPVTVHNRGKNISTGIYKEPVDGPVTVRTLNIDGDQQVDLKNHGGEFKAVYAYSYDHYPYWEASLDIGKMPMGQFGENLTISALDESKSCIGDQLKIGSAIFVITQPRVPCFKLGIRFDNPDMPRMFIKSGYTGFYLKVLEEGIIEAGDEVRVIGHSDTGVKVRELFEAYYNFDPALSHSIFESALAVPELSPEWRKKIEARC